MDEVTLRVALIFELRGASVPRLLDMSEVVAALNSGDQRTVTLAIAVLKKRGVKIYADERQL